MGFNWAFKRLIAMQKTVPVRRRNTKILQGNFKATWPSIPWFSQHYSNGDFTNTPYMNKIALYKQQGYIKLKAANRTNEYLPFYIWLTSLMLMCFPEHLFLKHLQFMVRLRVHEPYQDSETNVMHFLFNLLRIKGLYMFRALLVHPQEALHKLHLVYCVRVMSVGCSLRHQFHSNPDSSQLT
jgi:hypothetical protein